MICNPCREGGNHNATLQMLTDAGRHPAIEDALVRAAREAHSQCRGGSWCDCQHALGFYLNTPQIEVANAATA